MSPDEVTAMESGSRSVVIEFTRDSIQSSAPCSRVPSVKEKGVGSVSLIIALEFNQVQEKESCLSYFSLSILFSLL